MKSKFDDQSESESETKSVHMNDQEDDGYYLEDTPPDSPVELLPELPPYYPAIQGCRNVEEFHCLNRIEEGAYGVVYRAKDKKTGMEIVIDLKKNNNMLIFFEERLSVVFNLRSLNTVVHSKEKKCLCVYYHHHCFISWQELLWIEEHY